MINIGLKEMTDTKYLMHTRNEVSIITFPFFESLAEL